MCISKVETFIVEQKLKQPFYFSQWAYDTRQVCLVKITDQEGVFGWGEGYGPAGVVEAGIKFFRPFIMGQDPLQVEAIWQQMYRRSVDYARRGVLLASLSAIDIALWDLRGKILGQPVSVLLGGRRREQIQVYATGMYFVEDADLETVLVVHDLLQAIGLERFTIRVNDRRMLAGMLETLGLTGQTTVVLRCLDKLGKQTPEAVGRELAGHGITAAAADQLLSLSQLGGTPAEVLAGLEPLLASSEAGQAGLASVSALLTGLASAGVADGRVMLDPSIARGLDYYTGIMLESFLKEGKQSIGAPGGLKFGVSLTDSCIGWEETEELIRNFADSVRI